jgi:hypothetical protein
MAGEGPQNKLALSEGMKNIDSSSSFVGANGKPLIEIGCAAAELIPTIQYGNVSCGPVFVRRYVEDSDDNTLKAQIRATQTLCEEAIAEDRESVHALTRQSAGGRYTGE